jgi:hypothetical protein
MFLLCFEETFISAPFGGHMAATSGNVGKVCILPDDGFQ